MNRKQELNQRLLFFNPEITFDGTIGGIKLAMKIDTSNKLINWTVYEGDHFTRFQSFDEACDYYVKAIGED